MQPHYDAIVIGSGITGGWAAKELTEKGLKVLMLERGTPLEHAKGYTGEHKPAWEYGFRGYPDRQLRAQEYPVQGKCYAFDEATRHYFINDRDNPYQVADDQAFNWIRMDRFGGRSVTWGRQAYRFGPQDFRANAEDGHGTDWPIRYEDLAPWYDYVESFVGISGQAEGLAHFPDGQFLPPMQMYPVEKTIKARLQQHRPELTMTMGRCAILTQAHNGRAPCHYCGPCPRGCSTGSYFSTLSTTLPAAQATGRLEVRANAIVSRLLFDEEKGRIGAVEFIDRETQETATVSADLFFLCASTIASTQILLHSVSEAFPDGLANRSGVLGHYLMDHIKSIAGIGIFTDHLDRYFHGFRPTGTYIPRFRNLQGQDQDANFVRGYGFQSMTLRLNWHHMYNHIGIGAGYKERLRRPGPWVWALAAFGECLPQHRNRITLDREKRDAFGLPQVRIDFAWHENERNMFDDMPVQALDVLRAAGAVHTQTDARRYPPGQTIHEMGTARMGHDPRTSVLNQWNQAHDVPNLFVTDGSAMASSGYVNPSLTYMALTARACDYAAQQWHKKAL